MPMLGHRRSVRLASADYAAPGLYFVTVIAAGRARLFGRLGSGDVVLSDVGQIAQDEWVRTGDLRASVVLDAFVVMPDHVHLLFEIAGGAGDVPVGTGRVQGTPLVCPPDPTRHPPPPDRAFGGSDAGSVAAIMRQYKSAVTKRAGHPVWQRGYHDRIVRDAREAANVRAYIVANPRRG